MSFVVAASVVTIGAGIGKMLAGGAGAQSRSEAEHANQQAANLKHVQNRRTFDQYWDEMSGVKSQYAQTMGQAQLGMEQGEAGFEAGTFATGEGARGQYAETAGGGAAAQSGMATSGTVTRATEGATENLLQKYKSDMAKLVDTRSIAQKSMELTMSGAAGDKKRAERAAGRSAEVGYEQNEQQYAQTHADISAQPTGFFEGMFS